jgi:hypothetical protein
MRTQASNRSRIALLSLSLALWFGPAACARRTLVVKVIDPVPPETIGPAVVSGRLSVRFAPMWDEDWQFATLEANAVMAGVLPVRSDIENRSGEVVRMRDVRIVARDAYGRVWRLVDARKARKRIEKFYGVRLRNKEGDREYRIDFESNGLDLRADLSAGGRRQGLLFFELPVNVRRPVPVTITAADGRRD